MPIPDEEPMRTVLPTLLLIVVIMTAGCQRKAADSRYARTINIETLTVTDTVQVVTHTYAGEVEEGTSISLSFPFGGKVTAVYVCKNQKVRSGERLAEVDNTQQKNALQTAQATLAQAEDGFRRLQQVYDQGAVAEVKWVEMQTQLQKAQALAAAARQNLEDCTLRAPQDGIISECTLHNGQQLAPAQPVLRLINTQGVKVSFGVPETEISDIKIGDAADIMVHALGDAIFHGRVSEKNMTANRLSHSYTVGISLPNQTGRLLPGMICKVTLPRQGQSGFIVPAYCLQTRPEGPALWVAADNGRVTRRQVSVAGFAGNGVLISDGLECGEQVVTAGYQKLYEGASVSISKR